MKPAEFFEAVTRLNLRQAIECDDDYRLAVNAILSVDAVYGVLFEHLKEINHPVLCEVICKEQEMKDYHFKEYVATLSSEFRIVRDAAYATKHGRLSGKAARVVGSAQDVRENKLVAGLLACGDPLGGSAIFIVVNDAEYRRSRHILRLVEIFTEKLLVDLDLGFSAT